MLMSVQSKTLGYMWESLDVNTAEHLSWRTKPDTTKKSVDGKHWEIHCSTVVNLYCLPQLGQGALKNAIHT